MIFLEDLAVLSGMDSNGLLSTGFLGAIMAMIAVVLVVGLIIWLYSSFAFMAIAKKNKQSSPGLAWIPGIGPLIVAYRASKMHWWPWLLLIGAIIPLIGIIPGIVFAVYAYIWMWKTYEAVGKPGWWALVPLVSILFFVPVIGIILYLIGILGGLVLLGIAAWSKD